MGNLKEIVGIKNNQDFQTLIDTGTLTYGDQTIEYSDDAIYFTPDTEEGEEIDAYTKEETEALVDSKVADLVNSAPETLDTLGEIATALSQNQDVVEALNNAIGSKASQTALDDTNANVSKNAADISNLSSSKADLTNENQDITAHDITLQGFSMFDYCADLGTNKADKDAGNITESDWIDKLLTGKQHFGDKITDRNWVYGSNSYGATVKSGIAFKSGLLIQWGVIAPSQATGDYQPTDTVSFSLPFKTNGSYSLILQGKRKTETGYRDTTFITRNLTSTNFQYMWYGQHNSNDKWEVQWIAIGIGEQYEVG